MWIFAILGIVAVAWLAYQYGEESSNEYYVEKRKEETFVNNHREIRIGMKEEEVFCILGRNYSQSLLKDGTVKYEWRYRHQGYSQYVGAGMREHHSSFTRKISVKIKNGIVVETKTLNMDT